MKLRSARKGGMFYGCSIWPSCRGYRNPHGGDPGPIDMVKKQRVYYGRAWERFEELKRQGIVWPQRDESE